MNPMRANADAPVTISIAFVRGMLQGVRERGESVDAYLEDAGIASELLDEVGGRVTSEQYVVMFKSLMNRRNDEFLGFGSRILRCGSMALIVRAAASAPTIEVAMRRAAHTFGLLQDDVTLVAVRDGKLAGLALRFSDAQERPAFLHEMLLRVYWRLFAWLAGGRLPAARFDFAFDVPPYAGSYSPVFPATLKFGQDRSAFWFDAELLRCPVRRDESALKEFLTDAQSNIVVPRRTDGIGARVRSLLQHTQPAWPGLSACAEALHMSTATLQRHLAHDGISFQALKDDLRRDLAIVRLHSSTVPVAALASELGFADSAAFQRAFKNWTGSAPGCYRRSLSAEPKAGD